MLWVGASFLLYPNSHNCALTSTGAIECWGMDSYGAVSDAP